MPLEERPVGTWQREVPVTAARFLAEADRRCDSFFESGANKTLPAFVPANYELVYQALAALQEEGCLLGNRFCEWGSGLGTATCLAALLGFEAYGVEIEAELVQCARALAEDCEIEARFLQTSFLPEGYDFQNTQGGRELSMPPRARRRAALYPDVDWELEDIDLFYVYPWPGEQEATLELFDAVAADGAYLICYYGENEICIYRKYLDD